MSNRLFSILLVTYVFVIGMLYHACWNAGVNRVLVCVAGTMALFPAYAILRALLERYRAAYER